MLPHRFLFSLPRLSSFLSSPPPPSTRWGCTEKLAQTQKCTRSKKGRRRRRRRREKFPESKEMEMGGAESLLQVLPTQTPPIGFFASPRS
jgi:hypothetical protein